MYLYIILILFCALSGILMDKCQNRNSKNFKYFAYLIFFALFAVSALRFEVGRDYTDTYVLSYEQIVSGVKNVRMDIAVKFIYMIMAALHANAQWFFVISSFIINYFACKSIVNQSPSCKMSFWIFLCGTFYFFSMNGVRQAVAMMLFYYSFRYIKERNFKMYLLLNCIGVLFHESAILFLPLYFILGKKYTFKTKLLIVFGTLITSKFIIPFISGILINTRYGMYLTNGAYSAQDSMSFSMYLNIAIFILYEFLLKRRKDDVQGNIYSNIHFCGLIISLFATSIPLMIRIFMSFRFVEFLSVPYLIDNQPKHRYRRLIILSVMILYFAYFIWGVLIKNGNTVLPYKTVFSNLWW
jgi:hypothetical protein